jgi:hypothetical protein
MSKLWDLDGGCLMFIYVILEFQNNKLYIVESLSSNLIKSRIWFLSFLNVKPPLPCHQIDTPSLFFSDKLIPSGCIFASMKPSLTIEEPTIHTAIGWPAILSSHSFRIGMATQCAMDGYPDEQIMRFGRWRSNVYLRYIRIPN